MDLHGRGIEKTMTQNINSTRGILNRYIFEYNKKYLNISIVIYGITAA
jgi:hypothetical protein